MAEQPEFDFEAVFEVEDYMRFYADTLPPEVSDRQVAFLVEKLGLNASACILDLACGFGRHANCLAALGHHVAGLDLTAGFLEMAAREAQSLADFRYLDRI
jgi:SAM-dependent methyltransferase